MTLVFCIALAVLNLDDKLFIDANLVIKVVFPLFGAPMMFTPSDIGEEGCDS